MIDRLLVGDFWVENRMMLRAEHFRAGESLGSWQALAFIAVHQALFGVYMGCSFAPNHKGMPVLSGHEDLDYVQRQVLTSRNVHGNHLTDFALGGLNYQIEHHLFPNMPRPNLRRAHPLIRSFCHEHGIPFAETGLIDSYREVLRHLRDVGRPLRQPAGALTS